MFVKSRLILVIKIVIIFLCISCFIWQTTLLFQQYLKRRTVVNVQLETIKYNKIPAITLCYPRFLSMELILKRFPELKIKSDKNQSYLKKKSELKTKNNTIIEFYRNLTYFVETSDLTIDNLFELSIPFRAQTKPFKAIEVKLKGIERHINESLNKLGKMTETELEPIESIVFPNSGRHGFKCFTFFHHLNKQIRKYQIDIKEMTIKVFHDEKWFPIEVYGAPNEAPESSMISFAMHSPNNFPYKMNVDNFLRLKAGKTYEMTYNRLKTILMPPPYETKCRNYSLDDRKADKMRSDCVNQCIQQTLNQKCSHYSENSINQIKCFYRSDALWRKDYSHHNQNKIEFCPKYSESPVDSPIENYCIDSNLDHLNSECQHKCQLECVDRFYNFHMNYNIKHNLTKWYRENDNIIASITLGHNQLPDQITEHIPEMTFTQFVANFGGLFGMWLGLSALAILQYILKLIYENSKSILKSSGSLDIIPLSLSNHNISEA